jgi:multidrug resistance efflux pump
VQAEDPLFLLDRRPFELAVRQAQAKLTSTVQTIDASSTSRLAAQAEVTQSRVSLETARAQGSRVFRLEERGFASAAQAQPEQAKCNQASAIVRAPSYSIVTNVQLSDRELVAAGSTTLAFIDAEDAWVTVDLRENPLRGTEPNDPAGLLFDAVPGRIYRGHVQSIAWGIDAGRGNHGCRVMKQPASRWFEPARQIPARIELVLREGEDLPLARIGGKDHAVIHAEGTGNPIACNAGRASRVRAVLN